MKVIPRANRIVMGRPGIFLSRPPKPPSRTTETTFGIGAGYVTRDGKREIQTLCNDSANDSEDFGRKILLRFLFENFSKKV